jgi:syntaxin-binding protein 5
VQSLVAVGTNETKFGDGQIYIFGQKRVSAVLQLPRRSSVKTLQFCADKLLCLDARNDLVVFSLETKKMLSSYSPPGSVHVLCCDPSIDYAFLGMQSGQYLLHSALQWYAC